MDKEFYPTRVISNTEELNDYVDRETKTLLFTNGCFDLLHPGHIHLLKEARKLADVLVVGVNDDSSIKRLKGESRPVESLSSRIEKLAALKLIDFILPFTEDTPLHLIERLRPDILLKGGDYLPEQIVGAKEVTARGGELIIIPLVQGFSTTSIIESMK